MPARHDKGIEGGKILYTTGVTCCGETHEIGVMEPWTMIVYAHPGDFDYRVEQAMMGLGGPCRCAEILFDWKRAIRRRLRGEANFVPRRVMTKGLRDLLTSIVPFHEQPWDVETERELRAETAFFEVNVDPRHRGNANKWITTIDWKREATAKVEGHFIHAPDFEGTKVILCEVQGFKLNLQLDPVRYLWCYYRTGGQAVRWVKIKLDRDYEMPYQEPFMLLEMDTEPRNGWYLARAVRMMPPLKGDQKAVRHYPATVVHVHIRPPASGSGFWEVSL